MLALLYPVKCCRSCRRHFRGPGRAYDSAKTGVMERLEETYYSLRFSGGSRILEPVIKRKLVSVLNKNF